MLRRFATENFKAFGKRIELDVGRPGNAESTTPESEFSRGVNEADRGAKTASSRAIRTSHC